MRIGLLIYLLGITSIATSQSNKNLQTYTPSSLFTKGQWEFKSFQNLYTQTKSFSGTSKVSNGTRQTWLSSINQFLYGINNRINVGADVWLKYVKYESLTETRTGITGVGPKIKFIPFNPIKRLSVQSTFLFPVTNDLESRTIDNTRKPFLDKDRMLWINELYFDKSFNNDFQVFLRLSVWYSIARESFRDNNYVETPISVFFSYFPTEKITLYAMTEYAPTHYDDIAQQSEIFNTYYMQSGIGGKYQLIPGLLELEVLYTNFWVGSVGNGAGETYNVGFRIIR